MRALYVCLRADRPLLIATAIALVFSALPLFVTPFLPLVDLPNHVALASAIDDIWRGRGVVAEHLEIRWTPTPYWLFYALVAGLEVVFGALLAAKIAVGISVLLLPLGVMRLLLALGRDPRLGLLAFALTWDWSAYFGFMSYRLSLSLLVWVAAYAVEMRRISDVLGGAWRVALVALSHAQGFGLFAITLGTLSFRGKQTLWRMGLHSLSLAGGLVVLIPWVNERFETAKPKPQKEGRLYDMSEGVLERMEGIGRYTIGNIPTDLGELASSLALVLLLLTPLVLLFVKRRNSPGWWSGPILFLVASMLLYLYSPMWIGWPIRQWGVFQRHATLLLLAWLVLPRPDLSGSRGLFVAPAFAAVLLLQVAVIHQFYDFGTRARGFLDVIDAAPENQRVLGLVTNGADPVIQHTRVYHQFPAYIVAVKGGYEANLFDFPSNPVGHIKSAKRPRPGALTARRFTRRRHGVYWDLIAVKGPVLYAREGDIEGPRKKRMDVVIEGGGFRLFSVSDR